MRRKLNLVSIDLEVNKEKAGLFTRIHSQLELSIENHLKLQHHLVKVSEILEEAVREEAVREENTQDISLEEILLRR